MPESSTASTEARTKTRSRILVPCSKFPTQKIANNSFLPAAKPSGHRTVRVVVVVVVVVIVGGGDYFEVMTIEVDQLYQRSRSTFLAVLFNSHPKFPSGWESFGID